MKDEAKYCLTESEKAEALANAKDLRERLTESANERLLKLLIDDFRNLCSEFRDEGKSWKEIAEMAGLPEYVVMVLNRQTVGHRMTPDRQSGR